MQARVQLLLLLHFARVHVRGTRLQCLTSYLAELLPCPWNSALSFTQQLIFDLLLSVAQAPLKLLASDPSSVLLELSDLN